MPSMRWLCRERATEREFSHERTTASVLSAFSLGTERRVESGQVRSTRECAHRSPCSYVTAESCGSVSVTPSLARTAHIPQSAHASAPTVVTAHIRSQTRLPARGRIVARSSGGGRGAGEWARAPTRSTPRRAAQGGIALSAAPCSRTTRSAAALADTPWSACKSSCCRTADASLTCTRARWPARHTHVTPHITGRHASTRPQSTSTSMPMGTHDRHASAHSRIRILTRSAPASVGRRRKRACPCPPSPPPTRWVMVCHAASHTSHTRSPRRAQPAIACAIPPARYRVLAPRRWRPSSPRSSRRSYDGLRLHTRPHAPNDPLELPSSRAPELPQLPQLAQPPHRARITHASARPSTTCEQHVSSRLALAGASGPYRCPHPLTKGRALASYSNRFMAACARPTRPAIGRLKRRSSSLVAEVVRGERRHRDRPLERLVARRRHLR